MNLTQMNISTKLWSFIVLILSMLTAIAGFGLVRGADIVAEGRKQLEIAYQIVEVTTRSSGLTETNAARNQAIIVSSDPNVEQTFKDAVTATAAEVSALQKQLEALPLTDAFKAQMQKNGDLRKTVIVHRDKARNLKSEGKADEALQILKNDYVPAISSVR